MREQVSILLVECYIKRKIGGGVNGKAGDYFAFHRSFANGSGFETEVDLQREYDIVQQYSFL